MTDRIFIDTPVRAVNSNMTVIGMTYHPADSNRLLVVLHDGGEDLVVARRWCGHSGCH